MRVWIRRLFLLLALAAVVVGLRMTVFAPKPVQVSVVAAERGPVEWTVTNSKAGTVKARQRARLSPEIGGRVVELPFREGQRVEKGAVLLRLDDATLQAERRKALRDVVTAEAEARRACLAADQARREYDRNRKLADEQIVSVDLLERLESETRTTAAGCDAARAAVESARAGLDVIAAELDKATLRAPFDGVIAELDTELGEWVTPSPPALPVPPVVEIIDNGSIYISAPMDEVDSAMVHAGQPVRVTVDPYPGRDLEGRVIRVAPYVLDVEAQNRTVEIEVELADQAFASSLLPGTSADVEVILDRREDVLRLPTSALLEGSRVLVVEQGRLVSRDVQTGLRNWDFTEIVSGLQAGEEVVTTLDRAEIQAGVEVEIVDAL